MPETNLLTLLPPTASTPLARADFVSKASSRDSSRESSRDSVHRQSFEQKLNKAKKAKTTGDKSKVEKKTEKPVEKIVPQLDDEAVEPAVEEPKIPQAKVVVKPETAKPDEAPDETKDADPQRAVQELTADTAPVQPEPELKLPVKKSDKPSKSVATAPAAQAIQQPTPQVVQPAQKTKPQVGSNDQPVEKKVVAVAADHGDPTAGDATANSAATATASTDSSDDSTQVADPATAPDAEFGSGKVVAKNAAGKRSGADDSSGDAANSSESSAQPALTIAGGSLGNLVHALDPDANKETDQPTAKISGVDLTASGLLAATTTVGGHGAASASKGTAATPSTLQAQFVEDNHPKIITGIAGQLMPHGGTLQMRLDPPDLGALQVTVHMRDGVMTASFKTSNDGATKLLSHSLGQLKSGLEAAGVTVEKIHVEQSSRNDSHADSQNESKSAPQEQQRQAQQDQQRREMVQRMWKKLAGGDPLDLVA